MQSLCENSQNSLRGKVVRRSLGRLVSRILHPITRVENLRSKITTSEKLLLRPLQRKGKKDVVHWLRYNLNIRWQQGNVSFPIADRQKVRDFFAYNSVCIVSGESLVSILDVGGGSNPLYVAHCDWINRVAHFFEILSLLVNETILQLTVLCQIGDLRPSEKFDSTISCKTT